MLGDVVEHRDNNEGSGFTRRRSRCCLLTAVILLLLPVLLLSAYHDVDVMLNIKTVDQHVNRLNQTSDNTTIISNIMSNSTRNPVIKYQSLRNKTSSRIINIRSGENVEILSNRKGKFLPSDEEVKSNKTTFNSTAALISQTINGTNVSFVERAAALPPANMSDPTVSAVYSYKALSQLDRVKEKMKRGEPITLVMNGGSSSAGAPDVAYEDRYFVQLATRMSESHGNNGGANVTVVDRSHGARNTVHSAHLMPSFMPEKVDIVIWEFSINDGHKEADTRNQLILWLRNIEAHLDPPPLVLLVYLWKSPFQMTSTGRIFCRTFDQHGSIGSEYDFVLGHVNMAAYMTELKWDFATVKKAFLADAHHPNALFHHVIANNLWQLFDGQERPPPVYDKIVPRENRTDLDWICGRTSISQRGAYDMFDNTKGIARASYTADLPQNPANTTRPGMLVPTAAAASGHMQMKAFGKASESRSDRQLGIVLPCCNSSDIVVEFDVSDYGYIHALMLTLRCAAERRLGVRLLLDGIMMNDTQLIRPSGWRCLLGGYNMNIGDLKSLDVDLVLVSRSVKTIGFCDALCKISKYPLPMVSVSVF